MKPRLDHIGLDVSDYSLKLAYDPGARRLEGTATLSIVAIGGGAHPHTARVARLLAELSADA